MTIDASAFIDSSTSDHSGALQKAFDRAADLAHENTVFIPEFDWNIVSGVTVPEEIEVIAENGAKFHHMAASGVMISVHPTSRWSGGQCISDAANFPTYSGTLMQTTPGELGDREFPCYIRTNLRRIGADDASLGFHVNCDASPTDTNSYVQWSDFDINCFGLYTGVKITAKDGATADGWSNSNRLKARFSNCAICVDVDAEHVSNTQIGSWRMDLRVQWSTTTVHAMQISGLADSEIYLLVHDYDATLDGPAVIAQSGSQQNYRNKFNTNLNFYAFDGATGRGDMRLRGDGNVLVWGKLGGLPLLVDSSVAAGNDKWYNTNGSVMKGHLLYDQFDDKLKFSDGTPAFWAFSPDP